MTINLRQLEIEAGNIDGARILFERLIYNLLKVEYKTLRSFRPAPGDWGIDAYLGDLSSGKCVVWQCKYFPNGVGKSQQSQIRESFKVMDKKSKEHGFVVDAWTLCIPCNLSPEETKWWDGWKSRKMRQSGIQIGLLAEDEIIHKLLTDDARDVRLGFFGPKPHFIEYYLRAVSGVDERHIVQVQDPTAYENSVFIKKIHAAGIDRTSSAKTQFFNAELLASEVHDKGDENEINELKSMYEKIIAMWEPKFIEATLTENPDKEVPKVYAKMLESIQKFDKSSLITPRIMASFVHKQGFMQQLANLCEIGWTVDFKSIDEEEDVDNGTNTERSR